jgi:N-acyl-D-amino-acid deacylase
MWLTYFDKPQNQQYDGKTIDEIADMRDAHPVDAIMDLLLEEDLRISYTGAVVNAATLPTFIDHPLYMVGSDALLLGDHPSPMAYGTFPHILANYVREERRFSLEEGIRKMTSFPAQRLGISDRGLLRDGMKADITVFDPNTVSAPTTMADAKQFPQGIGHVIVNGQSVVENGVHTGATPGRALRRR